jgi:two-component system OmpR family response regulator
MFNIMVAEDDKNTARLMEAVLTHEGYRVFKAGNGKEALELIDIQEIDLIVLDVMMPVMNGYEFTKLLRENGNMTPILMVTAKQLPEERCEGFRAGTDDYLTKPFNDEELLLRIKALLRRSNSTAERKIVVGDVVLDYDALSVTKNGVSDTLPQKEFYLLYKLLSYPGKIFTRLELMDEIWGMESESGDNTVNVHINRLRKRFGDWPEFEIVAVRGIGYKAVKHCE